MEPKSAIPVFFGDVASPLNSELAGSLLPHSIVALDSPAPRPAWGDPAFAGRLAYIECIEDKCLPLSAQESWIEGTGIEWIIREIHAGHSAFASKSEMTANLVMELAKHWEGWTYLTGVKYSQVPCR